MPNRDRDETQDDREPRGGQQRRSGFGDDQGTRVGSPDPGKQAKGPSSDTTGEGLEGSVMEDEKDSEGSGSTGAGAEAVRGIHAFGSGQKGGQEERSPRDENLHDSDQPGSEPLKGTHRQHVSGYGSAGGKPRTSSDQREPLDYEGSGGEEDR
jgi:hypothetical protein